MNTTVEYKRPSHRTKHGEYESKTFINQNDVVGHITIALVWFNGLGWYYAIDLEAWGKSIAGRRIILDYLNSKDMWRRGKDLTLCAQAAEKAAEELCKKHGIISLNFSPYVLPRAKR